MSESNDVVVGVVEYAAAPSLAKPARGPVVVELVVDGAPSRRFADRSSHIPTPSTYDEFARPRFFAAVAVVSVVFSIIVSIIIIFPVSRPLDRSLSLSRSLSLDRASRASSFLSRDSRRARLPPLPASSSDDRSSSIHPSHAFHSKNRKVDRPTGGRAFGSTLMT